MTGQVTMINEQRLREAGLVPEHLRAAAREDVHRWRTVRQPQGLDAFTARMEAAQRHLDALSAALDRLPTT
ncbi:MAG: hypothetical protein WBD93_21365, partial [Acidobacteriaceae bacterium]